MPSMSAERALVFACRGARNLIQGRPLAISLEVIHSCNCNCAHCDKGGPIPGEKLAPPERFGELVRELQPLVAQISGGEPLLRDDVFEIARRIKPDGGLPHVVFVSNAELLTEAKYLELKRLGVDEFSISLDYPDERHDDNRGIPGLYAHLGRLLPALAAHRNHDITLISVIRRQNIDDLPALAEHAVKWDISINFSAYTPLRTGNADHSPRPEDLPRLRQQIEHLIDFKRRTGRIFTTESSLWRYYDFFARGSFLPDCRAGYRSLVVNPDGRLAPCAMQAVSFETRSELIERFSKGNQCGGCSVSMRTNTEKSIGTLIADAVGALGQMRRRRNGR
ncbi:MAG: radical SAM protein [Candidatus Eisenbacteria bacterium]|nr:radical SAM protein [Candidatus Eisenbacteria bacterium]